MDAPAVLQRKLKRAAAICKMLHKAVSDKFGNHDLVIHTSDGVSKGFTRAWEIKDSDGNPSQATVSCSVIENGSLKVEFSRNIAERLDAKATDDAIDGTPSFLLRIPLPLSVEEQASTALAPETPKMMIVRVKSPQGQASATMCGFWKLKESLDPDNLDFSPYHTYAVLLDMLYGLCSV